MTVLTRSLLVPLAVLVVACGAESSADAGRSASAADLTAADVVVVADDMVFVDPPTELPAGEIVLGLDNQGRAPHDLTFEGAHGTVAGADGGSAAVGELALEPGSYTVYCAVSGHRQAGMEFELEVS